jgi:hypothetical protein
MRWKLLPVLAFVSVLTGCAMSRADKLEAKSERVEKALLTDRLPKLSLLSMLDS